MVISYEAGRGLPGDWLQRLCSASRAKVQVRFSARDYIDQGRGKLISRFESGRETQTLASLVLARSSDCLGGRREDIWRTDWS